MIFFQGFNSLARLNFVFPYLCAVNLALTSKTVQEFLKENQNQDFRKISLMNSPFQEVSSAELAQQIKGLQVAKHKFPIFYQTQGVFYPPTLNLEQASSWTTAQYKAELVQGRTLIDLTAGMGIDAWAFAQKFEEVTALERNPELVEICQYNYKLLQQNNLHYQLTHFEEYFDAHPDGKWDVIYLDPARRKDSQKKFILEDLEPNIKKWMEVFFEKATNVFIKLSPLLDLKKLVEEIPQIQEIHLVAVKNEVKELLLICENFHQNNPLIFAVNLESNQPEFRFQLQEEQEAEPEFSTPKKFLYEPNAAVLKSGAFKLISSRMGLLKLQTNTHLYTSDEFLKDFPGKIYEVLEEIKDPKKQLKNQAFHVISKNYPMTVELIRKKYNLKESEEQSLIFTQTMEGKCILKARRLP